jgi:hypothetical protein
MPDLWAVLSWLGQTLASSAIMILAFIGLRSTALGERFLSHHLDRRIAALKHSHEQEIETLKADLGHVLDRGRRANEQEYDSTARIWKAFVDAYLKTNQCVVSFVSYPELNELSDDDLRAFLETTDLSDGQRKQVAAAADKERMFTKIVQLRQINSARGAVFDGRMLLRTEGIFLPKDMMESFKNAFDLLSKAETEQYVNFQHELREHTASMRLLDEGEQLFDNLQSSVRKRLLNIRTST